MSGSRRQTSAAAAPREQTRRPFCGAAGCPLASLASHHACAACARQGGGPGHPAVVVVVDHDSRPTPGGVGVDKQAGGDEG